MFAVKELPLARYLLGVALWTFILFRCRKEEQVTRELECARVWLSRSSECPLAFIIDASAHGFLAEVAAKQLTPHYARW